MRKLIDRIKHDIIKRNNTYKYYNFLLESQYWSSAALVKHQLDLFNRLWTHAVNNVPYYQKIAKECGFDNKNLKTIADIQELPILTKEIVRNNFDEITAKNLPPERFGKNSTSGSSGSNFYFFSDKNKYAFNNALELRRYKWMGASKFDKELIIWGAHFDVEKSSQRKFSKFKDWLKNKKLISGYDLSDNGIYNIYKTMRSYQPAIIKSYPSILMTIAKYFIKHNLRYQPKVIQIGGEKLHDFQKKKIEDTFNCSVYDFYGARDMNQIAQNCEKGTGLHVFMENVVLEVVNEEGIPINEGEGDLVITDLHNYVMPFIRYKIGDRVRIRSQQQCSCGRNLQLIEEVVGRSFEIIQFPNGNRVGGTFWTLIMKSVEGIKDFQVIQEKEDEIKIIYVPDRNDKTIDLENLTNRIKGYGGDQLKIFFEKASEIKPNNAGKFQFVRSKLNKQ